MGKKIDNILTKLGTNNSSQIATAVLAGFKMIFLPIATMTDKTATPEQKKYTMARDVIMEGLALITYVGVTGQIQKHATSPICSKYYKDKAKKIENGTLKPVENLTKEEIAFLKNVDSKKIKEAGNDFLTQISEKHKVMSDDTKNYIEKLDGIVRKINGDNEKVKKSTFDEYITDLYKDRKPRKTSLLIFQDFKKAGQDPKKILDSMKAFQNTRIALSQISVWTLALIVIPPICNVVMKIINNKKSVDNAVNDVKSKQQLNAVDNSNKVKDKKALTTFQGHYPQNTGMRV